jgi:hypothetical protein
MTAILSWLSKPLVKYGLMALAAAGLVLGALWYIDDVRKEGFEAGKTATESQVKTNTIVIQREIHRAEDRGPRTPSDVSKRLRDGSF